MTGSISLFAQGKQFVTLDKPATLTGKLIQAKTTSITDEKTVRRYPAIQLTQPLFVEGVDEAVPLIQLAMNNTQQFKSFDKLKGKKVFVRCKELYEWDNSNHHTPVLCFVEKISAQ